jgi:hypothetical protein
MRSIGRTVTVALGNLNLTFSAIGELPFRAKQSFITINLGTSSLHCLAKLDAHHSSVYRFCSNRHRLLIVSFIFKSGATGSLH